MCRPGTLVRIKLSLYVMSLFCICLLKLIAEDADSQPNGQIHFSIVNGDRDNEFAVDPLLGLVKVKKKLDRERVSWVRPASCPFTPIPSLASDTGSMSLNRKILHSKQ